MLCPTTLGNEGVDMGYRMSDEREWRWGGEREGEVGGGEEGRGGVRCRQRA